MLADHPIDVMLLVASSSRRAAPGRRIRRPRPPGGSTTWRPRSLTCPRAVWRSGRFPSSAPLAAWFVDPHANSIGLLRVRQDAAR